MISQVYDVVLLKKCKHKKKSAKIIVSLTDVRTYNVQILVSGAHYVNVHILLSVRKFNTVDAKRMRIRTVSRLKYENPET